MYIIIGIALLLIIVVVLDCIRYKHTQSQRINDAEHTQRYVTNKRNGYDNGTLSNWNNNTSSIIPETKFKWGF